MEPDIKKITKPNREACNEVMPRRQAEAEVPLSYFLIGVKQAG